MDSDLVAGSTEVEAAWYVLTILLRIGRPARIDEIIARSKLCSVSHDFLRFLSRTPNSPLFFSEEGLVTVSSRVEVTFGEFFVGGEVQLLPKVVIRCEEEEKTRDFWKFSLWNSGRKRKRNYPLTDSKRGALTRQDNGSEIHSYRMPMEDFIRSAFTLKGNREVYDNTGRKQNYLPPNLKRMTQMRLEYGLGIPSYPMPIKSFNLKGNCEVYDILKRKQNYPLPASKRRALMRLENRLGIPSYHMSMDDSIPSTSSIKGYHEVYDILGKHNPPSLMNIAKCASRTVKEIMPQIPVLQFVDSLVVDSPVPLFLQRDLDSVSHSQIIPIKSKQVTSVDDNFVTLVPSTSLASEVPQIRRKQFREKILISDNSLTELVVDDSEDKLDQAQATTTIGSTHDLNDDPLFPAVASKNSEEEFLNGTEMENEKTNKNKRAETFGGKLILNKLRKTQYTKIPRKGNREEATAVAKKQGKGSNKFPHFESFIVEEEEGSGGYGTVYRAKRKSDGKTFAIKCPHPKAHPHHIHNELKMLERFGGRCFIIKYEGCFKSENSKCFVLEHVEHDRPEILKKEMNVTELQWYGYCMFRALASLHKQGVVHRDVKPGNFLFSCKQNKGYLIDFNLALDLNHKPQPNSKSHPSTRKSTDRSAGLLWKPSPSSSSSKIKKPQYPDSTKRPAAELLSPDKECRSKHGEGSGVTSAREATSTRTPSGDRLREPVPCRGRKELINLAHEVMQSPGKIWAAVPVQRKRVAAPLGRAERHLGLLSPMPLLSGGLPVSAAPRCSEKRQKTEGPCVGTKGFRAPEVLLKSIHQSCKVDVWSAGVTLLYLMIGRAPFAGDPEQNIKEIAKLRGSEDLWEVAKLHNRESSFPSDLLELDWLKRTTLEEWCEKNSKKGKELTQSIPKEMWNLVDQCLTVNPRLRISAEDALEHDFFAPCRESLRRQRLLRLTTSPASTL